MDCPSEGRFSPGRALEGGSLSDGLPDGHAGSPRRIRPRMLRRGSALGVGAPFSQQMRSGPPFVREARRDLEMKSIVPRASPLSCRVRAGIV